MHPSIMTVLNPFTTDLQLAKLLASPEGRNPHLVLAIANRARIGGQLLHVLASSYGAHAGNSNLKDSDSHFMMAIAQTIAKNPSTEADTLKLLLMSPTGSEPDIVLAIAEHPNTSNAILQILVDEYASKVGGEHLQVSEHRFLASVAVALAKNPILDPKLMKTLLQSPAGQIPAVVIAITQNPRTPSSILTVLAESYGVHAGQSSNSIGDEYFFNRVANDLASNPNTTNGILTTLLQSPAGENPSIVIAAARHPNIDQALLQILTDEYGVHAKRDGLTPSETRFLTGVASAIAHNPATSAQQLTQLIQSSAGRLPEVALGIAEHFNTDQSLLAILAEEYGAKVGQPNLAQSDNNFLAAIACAIASNPHTDEKTIELLKKSEAGKMPEVRSRLDRRAS